MEIIAILVIIAFCILIAFLGDFIIMALFGALMLLVLSVTDIVRWDENTPDFNIERGMEKMGINHEPVLKSTNDEKSKE